MYHSKNTPPTDYQYDPVADTWTQLLAVGGGYSGDYPQVMSYDARRNALVGLNPPSSGYQVELWLGLLPAGSTATVSRCDLNGDGVINQVDVQLAVNQGLGTTPCGSGALIGSGVCSIVDVQRVINASLGGSCRTGN